MKKKREVDKLNIDNGISNISSLFKEDRSLSEKVFFE